jgi:photosystem I subunit IX
MPWLLVAEHLVSKNNTSFFKALEIIAMKDFTTYLSTAPVLALISLTVVAGLLIEINRFFPDALIFAF